MANTTPNLDISHIATNQNQKEATANSAFDEFDGALTALLVKALPADADYTLTATEGGEALGNIAFNSSTAEYFRQKVQAPWFAFHLKDKGSLDQPEALMFQTGRIKTIL